MTWIDAVINAMNSLGGIASYSELYEYIEKNPHKDLPKTWKAIIRATIEDHSSDAQFRSGKDIFYSVDGIGNGVWGLRSLIEYPIKSFDSSDDINIPNKSDIIVTRIIRDSNIVRTLKILYKNKCQICGQTIQVPNGFYSEGHHIRPLGNEHNGDDSINNILILCPNHHVEFDFGTIAVDPNNTKILHMNNDNLFHNKQLFIHRLHNLNSKNFYYHLENIFLRNGSQSN